VNENGCLKEDDRSVFDGPDNEFELCCQSKRESSTGERNGFRVYPSAACGAIKGDRVFVLNPINPWFHQDERGDMIDEARYIAFDVWMGLMGTENEVEQALERAVSVSAYSLPTC
jgi:hypothetical protein